MGPDTVATVTSQYQIVKHCKVEFKVGVVRARYELISVYCFQRLPACAGLKMTCSNFNVPAGPERWFSLQPPGERFTNGNKPRNWKTTKEPLSN